MKEVYIGIDTHKDSNKLACAFVGRERPQLLGSVSSDLNRILDMLRRFQKKHGLAKEQLHICYEAGPTGFVLARRLIGLGYDCIVVAPSKTPTQSGDKVKTDRRDARKLAGLHRAGELEAIHIPDVEDEVIRDVCRGRTDAVHEVKRTKQQLMSFLLRNGYRYKGMGHHQAVRAWAYKWIRILYVCWKEHRPYDEMHYISVLKKRGSSLMKLIAEHPDVVRLNGPVRNQLLG